MRTDALASRDELEDLVASYRHLQEEHRRAHRGGRIRRRTARELERVASRFERMLADVVADEELQQSWRRHLYHRGVEPPEPAAEQPLLFRGRSDSGSELLVRRRHDGDLDALVAGVLVERLARADELLSTEPHLRFAFGGEEFAETFRAEAGALAALRDAVEHGATPDASYLRGLAREGLIDPRRGLTPRGRRALGSTAAGAQP